ncbi:RluA family pseudouridine synthase [Streptomyces sp. NPDC060194]|uniref:RluA family pseudouridine synthase n=1 Tax=Streptomyces sp. NPDC060194 TaxID=3347069 RepID=UPI00364DCD4C
MSRAARRARRQPPPAPLPQRGGIDPVRVRLPQGEEWATVRDYLVARYGRAIGSTRVDAMLREGRFHGLGGPVGPDAAYEPGAYVWFHRDLPPERPVPFAVEVVHRDETIVVVDKPHFLATTPRGSHVTETALARLRRDLDLPELTPAHRLDRLTAGLLLLVVRPEDRGAYQALFRDRRVRKEYEAVAPYDPALELPRTIRSRIVKERGVLAAREVPGEPNAETRVELLDHHGGLGRYRLLPATGQTHQLRVHMNALGLPLLHDPLYPVVDPDRSDPEREDFTRPLQLLARSLDFTDPRSGRPHRFRSGRSLGAWLRPRPPHS